MDPLGIAILVMISSFVSSFLMIWSHLKPISIPIDNQKVINQSTETNPKSIDRASHHPVLTQQQNTSPEIVVELDTPDNDLLFTSDKFNHYPYPMISRPKE